MAAPIYGLECWGINKQQESRIEADQMRCLRAVAAYRRLDHIKNKTFRQELNTSIFNILDKIVNIKQIGSITWKEWMEPDLLKYFTNIQPKVRLEEVDHTRNGSTNSDMILEIVTSLVRLTLIDDDGIDMVCPKRNRTFLKIFIDKLTT
jgi:hypothetical protein